MAYTFYMSKAEKGGINSGKDVSYFITAIELQPHTHPLYVGRMIKENADSLGLGIKDGFYENVIAIWSGNIDDKIAENKALVKQWEPHQKTHPVQYYDCRKMIDQLSEAKRVMNDGLVINPFLD